MGGAIVKVVDSLQSQSVDPPQPEYPPQPPFLRGENIPQYPLINTPQHSLIREELLGKSVEEGEALFSLSVPSVEDLEGDIECFAQKFLPQVYRILGDKKLVLLIDEFDVLSDSTIDVAGGSFFQYLSSLIDRGRETIFNSCYR